MRVLRRSYHQSEAFGARTVKTANAKVAKDATARKGL